jgi:hypothetical protein
MYMSDLIAEEDGNTYVHGINAYDKKVALKRHITCTRCKKKGHHADKCPERNETLQGQQKGTAIVQVGVTCAQNGKEIIPKSFIIMDSASTNSCFMNEDLFSDVIEVPTNDHLKLVSTGGTTTFHNKATCNLIPMEVWFKGSLLANILSLKKGA